MALTVYHCKVCDGETVGSIVLVCGHQWPRISGIGRRPRMRCIGRCRLSSMSAMVSTRTGRLACRAKVIRILCRSLRRWCEVPPSRGRLDRPSSVALSISVPLVWAISVLYCVVCLSVCPVGGPKKSVICL